MSFYKTITGQIYIGTKMSEEDILLTEDEQEQFIQSKQANNEAKEFLKNTDWMVIRHRDQLESGAQTNLTEEDFQELLSERQQARDKVLED